MMITQNTNFSVMLKQNRRQQKDSVLSQDTKKLVLFPSMWYNGARRENG